MWAAKRKNSRTLNFPLLPKRTTSFLLGTGTQQMDIIHKSLISSSLISSKLPVHRKDEDAPPIFAPVRAQKEKKKLPKGADPTSPHHHHQKGGHHNACRLDQQPQQKKKKDAKRHPKNEVAESSFHTLETFSRKKEREPKRKPTSPHKFNQIAILDVVTEIPDVNSVFSLADFRKLDGFFMVCVHRPT
jgi:hypothetical protein